MVELDSAIEALIVSWHHWVLNLGPSKDLSTIWDVAVTDGVSDEDLLDTSELEPSVGSIKSAWVSFSDGGESDWLLSGREPGTNGVKRRLSFFFIFSGLGLCLLGVGDRDEQGGDITVHCVFRN